MTARLGHRSSWQSPVFVERCIDPRKTWEAFYRAAHTLVVGDTPLRQRLGSACRSHLEHVSPADFADFNLRRAFQSLRTDGDPAGPLRTDWPIEDECRHAAGTILFLFVELTRSIEQDDVDGWLKNRLFGGSCGQVGM